MTISPPQPDQKSLCEYGSHVISCASGDQNEMIRFLVDKFQYEPVSSKAPTSIQQLVPQKQTNSHGNQSHGTLESLFMQLPDGLKQLAWPFKQPIMQENVDQKATKIIAHPLQSAVVVISLQKIFVFDIKKVKWTLVSSAASKDGIAIGASWSHNGDLLVVHSVNELKFYSFPAVKLLSCHRSRYAIQSVSWTLFDDCLLVTGYNGLISVFAIDSVNLQANDQLFTSSNIFQLTIQINNASQLKEMAVSESLMATVDGSGKLAVFSQLSWQQLATQKCQQVPSNLQWISGSKLLYSMGSDIFIASIKGQGVKVNKAVSLDVEEYPNGVSCLGPIDLICSSPTRLAVSFKKRHSQSRHDASHYVLLMRLQCGVVDHLSHLGYINMFQHGERVAAMTFSAGNCLVLMSDQLNLKLFPIYDRT